METPPREQMGSFITGTPAPTQEEKNWGMIAHLSGLIASVVLSVVAWFIPLVHAFVFLGPLVVMLTKGKESAWVASQAREALNFQILISIGLAVGSLLSWTIILACIGVPLMVAVGLTGLVLSIIAAIKVNGGEAYHYPYVPKLVK
jgi:uncharacterized Tic20 family protein